MGFGVWNITKADSTLIAKNVGVNTKTGAAKNIFEAKRNQKLLENAKDLEKFESNLHPQANAEQGQSSLKSLWSSFLDKVYVK